MSNLPFYIRQNDTSAAILYTFDPVTDLTGATVTFSLKPAGGGTAVIDRAACSIEVNNPGQVKYAWVSADTIKAGRYVGKFESTFADLSVGSNPNRGWLPVFIDEDI